VTTSTDAPAELNGICYLAGTPTGAPPALPSPNPQHAGLDISPWPTVGPMPSGGCTAWPCSVSQTNVGGSINSLADVAQYYYVTDLRPASVWAANIATNNVPAVGAAPEDDKATHQHMTTFTVALGVSGTLAYDAQYKKKIRLAILLISEMVSKTGHFGLIHPRLPGIAVQIPILPRVVGKIRVQLMIFGIRL